MVILSLASVCWASAQELEYNMELGGMAGGCFYMGDANFTTPFKEMAMMGGVLARYNINPRMAIKGDLAVGHIKGSTEGMANKFPGEAHGTFSRNVYELGAQFGYRDDLCAQAGQSCSGDEYSSGYWGEVQTG